MKDKELNLPLARVKTIMKSSPDVDTVGQDGLFLVAKATEMLIHHITKEAHKQNSKGNMLEYKHLAEVVQTSEPLEFLREIMPRKITVRQFKELMAAKEHDSSSDSDSDSQSEDSSSSSNSSEGKNGEYKGSGAAAKENGKSESSKSTSSEESSEDN